MPGVCMARGCAWLGGSMCDQGACMAGDLCAGGHAWPGACGGWGECVVGGMHAQGVCMAGQGCVCVCVCVCVAGGHAWLGGGMHGRRDGHCSGWYASYWNAFLLNVCEQISLTFAIIHSLNGLPDTSGKSRIFLGRGRQLPKWVC